MSNPVPKNLLLKTLGLYAAGSWVALQVVDVLVQNAGLPAWVFTLALVLLIIGLPIVVATAYVQGLAWAPEPEQAAPARSPRALFTWRNAMLGGVGAMALWGVLVTGWLILGRESAAGVAAPEEPGIDRRSVAVLPFATRAAGSDEEAEIFAQGMHDDLLTQLAKIESLTVISRTSVMQYAETTKPIPAIAEELGVATVVEGAVQRAGNRVRVNIQLIEAATDGHLWAETYDEELTAANIFAIQTDLSTEIAQALQASLSPETQARLADRPTESLEAFDLHARARHLALSLRSRNRRGLAEARSLAERAIVADSGYAQAWSTLASVIMTQYSLSILSPDEAFPAARAALDRALTLNPNLAEAHGELGFLRMAELDYEAAEAAMLRALELNPGSASEHRRYARLLTDLGRIDEAVVQARRSVELDPLSLTSRATYADVLFWHGDWAGTVRESEKVLEMEPENDYAYYNLGYGHAMLGESDAALHAFRRSVELNDDPSNRAGLAWAWARFGQRDSALAVLANVPAQGSLLKEIAIVHATLGDLDTAFDYLDRAADEDPGSIGLIRSDPTADPLKQDPRYERLLRRVGL